MSLEEVVGRLKTHEERLRGFGEQKDPSLLLTHSEWSRGCDQKDSKGNSKGRGTHRGRGRGRGNGRGTGENRETSSTSVRQKDYRKTPKDKSKITCFCCDKLGHYASECPVRKRGEEANLTQVQDEEPTLMMVLTSETICKGVQLEENVTVSLYVSGEHRSESGEWYLDNGASNHMTGNKANFHELDESITGQVRFGDGSTVAIKGKGSILFECKNGDQRLMNEVYFIPSLKNNIISLGQLTEDGSRVELDGSWLRIFDRSNTLLLKTKRTPSRLYKTTLLLDVQVAYSQPKM